MRFLLSLAGLALSSLAAAAQPEAEPPKDEAPWVQLTFVDVIPSMVEEFVAVQRELTARAKDAKIPWRTVSRTEVFGDTYRFVIATPVRTLAAFDKAPAPDAALVTRAERCITRRESYAVRSLSELSKPLPADQKPDLMLVNVANVFPGREQDYVNVMKSDFLPHFDEAKVHYATGLLAFGGESGFLHVFYVPNFAELDKGSPVMRALGPEGAQAVTAKLSGVVSSSSLWIARVLPELSYRPEPKTEPIQSDMR
ncbi:MAG TPA: hypothetical protein VIG29_12240 [Vicinamibacteria bacterium]